MRDGLRAFRHRLGAALVDRSAARRRAGWACAVAGPGLVAVSLLPLRSSIGLTGFLFAAQLAIVAVAVINGVWPALAAAGIAILLGAFLYVPPYGGLNVDPQTDLFALTAFVVVGVVVGFLVDEFARLANQQAALRRVAMLVARAATPDELFSAVTDEVGQQLPVDFARMARYESDDSATFVAAWSVPGDDFPVPSRWRLTGESVSAMVSRTGRAARIDNFGDLSGPLAVEAQKRGTRTAVGVPIVVEGRLWGVMIAGSTVNRPLPRDAEERLAEFTDLLSTAIANAESRAELTASRARVVAAADETRRRIERDLHDGTQQRLVSLALELRAAEARVPADLAEHRAMLADAATGLAQTVEDLQEISRGIHPAILSKGGLGPALKTLARRSAVAVELDLRVGRRLPEQVEVAAYYVVSESLTNVAKYAQASVVQVEVNASDSVIELAVRDDGIGGADPSRGSGLIGLKDRVEALGGTIEIASGHGTGTSVVARIPIDGKAALDGERRRTTARG